MGVLSIVLPAVAGIGLTLGFIYAIVWVFDREARANVMFAVAAFSIAGMVIVELRLMRAATPEEYATWVRAFQAPIFVAIASIVLFVRSYFGTGRRWLAWTIIAIRAAVLVASFLLEPNLNFREIATIGQAPFLGEQVAIVGQTRVGGAQWIATLSLVLFVLFVIDATVALWQRGTPEARHRAYVVGGSIMTFFVLAATHTQLIIWGVYRAPIVVSVPFLVTLLAMAFELSRELLRSARVAHDLLDSEQRLYLAVKAAGLGIWSWNIAAGSISATDKARSLLAMPDEPTIDPEQWFAAVHPDDRVALWHEIQSSLENDQELSTEFRALVDDETRWIAIVGRAEFDRDKNPVVMRGIVRDVSRRKQAQAEIQELRRELAHTGRVTLLGHLASSLAHELNQPLGAILRNAEAAEILLRAPSPDVQELRAIVTDICNDDRRAGSVIDGLRSLLRRGHLDLGALRLETLLSDTIALVSADAAARHVKLDLVTPSTLPPVLADRVHLSQVLLNLLVNGMDAANEARQDRPSVKIEVACNGDDMVEVAITDSGAGMTPDVLEHVFEPFFTTKPHGMGMGLPVSRHIIEAHGGHIWAECGSGHGATFRFTVPVAEAVPA